MGIYKPWRAGTSQLNQAIKSSGSNMLLSKSKGEDNISYVLVNIAI